MENPRLSSLVTGIPWFVLCGALLLPPLHGSELEGGNHLEVSLGGVVVDGDKPAFSGRVGLRPEVYGGIESLRLATEAAAGWTVQVDGRALANQDDYFAHLVLSKEEWATIRLGFETYRYWSANYAAAFPPSLFIVPVNPALGLDRSRFYAEFLFHRPDAPVYSLKYTRQMRDGMKDATIWGDLNLPGGVRSVVPSFYDIDETRDILEAKVSREGETTEWAAGFSYERAQKDNRTVMHRQPGGAADRYLVNRDGADNDIYTIHGSVRTRLSEELALLSSALWTSLTGRITGDRIYGASTDPVYDPVFPGRQARDSGILDLLGNSHLKQFVATLGAHYEPAKHWSIVPSLRLERMYQDVSTGFTTTSVGTGALLPVSLAQETVLSNKDFNSATGRLDVRYTGVPKWTFHASGIASFGEGNLEEEHLRLGAPSPTLLLERATDYRQEKWEIRGGAHWQIRQGLRLSLGGYHRFNRSHYDHSVDSGGVTGGDRFPAYFRQQDFRVNDGNARLTWRINPKLTSVTRYDYQIAHIYTRAMNGLEVNSGTRERQILNQSFSWQPLARLSLQSGFSVVDDRRTTPANADPSLVSAGIVPSDRMDYIAWNATAYYAISDDTDLMLSYNGHVADNSYDNSATGLPLGSSTEENSVISTLTHRFSEYLTLTLQYGLYTYRDGLSAHRQDFTAHVVSTRLRYKF